MLMTGYKRYRLKEHSSVGFNKRQSSETAREITAITLEDIHNHKELDKTDSKEPRLCATVNSLDV